jgi:hypothetical protein
MYAQQIGVNPMNNSWNRDYQTVGFGNYGYGIYTQEADVYRNLFTGRLNVEREVDFTPLTANHFQPYTGYAAAIHQHYIN